MHANNGSKGKYANRTVTMYILPAFLFVLTDGFMHFRGPVGNKRIVVKRNIGERIGGPPQKRFNPGNAYNR